jgi:predicted PurR-regulated permease PerM
VNGSESASGPWVWTAVIAVTLALLSVMQQMLWLVVPLLLALILYYLLYPLTRILVWRGISSDSAAALVTAGFLTISAVAVILVAPKIAASALDWHGSAERYLQGGMQLLAVTLRDLEASFTVFANAHLADSVAQRLAGVDLGLALRLEPAIRLVVVWMPLLLLVPFLAFFFLRDGRRFQRFLGRAVPNAFFEKTLFLLNEVDRTMRAYFQGLVRLTLLDALTLAGGLWLMGFPGALGLGVACAVLAWIPYVGSIAGGILVVLVAATDFPGQPLMAYSAAALFVLVRLLDDFVFMPATIGNSLKMHPSVTVLMIFVGGTVAGISGLMLVLPLLGVVRVIGETVGQVIGDARLMARHRQARRLRRQRAEAGL